MKITFAGAGVVVGAGTDAGTGAGAEAGVFRDVAWGREELMRDLALLVG